MNMVLILLNREWIEFKKNFLSVFLLWFLLPLLIHITIALPLSKVITVSILYLNWSSAGIWVVSSCLVSLLISIKFLNNIKNQNNHINALLQTPVSNIHLLNVSLIKGSIYGIFQFVIAITITSVLKQEYFSTFEILLITIQIGILVLFFSSLGTLLGMIVSNILIFIQLILYFFLILAFGLGTFIPLNKYPIGYILFVDKIPLTNIILNLQKVIINEPLDWLSFFTTILLIVLTNIISLIISYKVVRKI